jgi:hypothetical protein
MSNINLIELCVGIKLTELDSRAVITSERNDPMTRKSFKEINSTNRFKSFF